MNDVVLVGIRAIAAGALVVAISMLSDKLKPKMFAGLLGGAPSVATVSLLVNGIAMGSAKDAAAAAGMIAGAVGLVFFSLAAAVLVKHLGAIAGSAIAWMAWAIPAVGLYWLFLH